MQKIGIYGGTFDPIHSGHVKAAQNAVKALSLDKIILIPAGSPPHKSGNYRDMATHRLNMTHLAAELIPKCEVSDFEIKAEGKSFTYKTLTHFKEIYKNAELYFIMGDEAYAEFSTWCHPEIIRSLAKLVVMRRTGEGADSSVLYIDTPPIVISSHEIRESLASGKHADLLLPDKVYNYIKENNLYGSETNDGK